ncbi:hypothetical protein GPECTOR_49g552 [Gonium pectorale]|uniref:FAST kinase leucine-rich domain-containing protein n=1 Tax=Gonium pectorale TaxID=33097 RepID=A0A150G816_GONPE|nr:hypothetical protein GPECTOR_49g552 [Gonium pectorale]|eukprot:KXZ45968.1 hypothetical protein GPECTOR_49g552 [Gonium pectorale]
MLRCSAPLLVGFSAQDLSQTLWSIASLECRHMPHGFLAAFLQISRQRLGTFGPQAISNTVWAMARLRFRPPPDWLDALCEASAPQLPAFSAQALSNMACALAHMEHLPSELWCSSFMYCCDALWAGRAGRAMAPSDRPNSTRSAPDAAPLAPQSIALTAWAVARLGLRPSAAWVHGLASAAACAAPRMNGQDVANVLWALSSLCRRRLDDDPVNSQHAPPSDGAPPSLPDGVAPRLAPLLAAWWRCVGSMEPQQLSACLVACAHLGLTARPHQQPHHSEQAAAAEVGQQQQWHASAALLQVPADLLERALECLGRGLPAASGQCVANALWAVARLDARPASSWVMGAVGRFMECVEDDDAGPQEIANVWWALGRLRWAPPAETAHELLSRSLAAACTGDLRSGELAMLLWGITRLGLKLPKASMHKPS